MEKLIKNKHGQWTLVKAWLPRGKEHEAGMLDDQGKLKEHPYPISAGRDQGGKPKPSPEKPASDHDMAKLISQHVYSEDHERNEEIKFDLKRSGGKSHRWQDRFDDEDPIHEHEFVTPSEQHIARKIGPKLKFFHDKLKEHDANDNYDDDYDSMVEHLRDKIGW